MPPGAMLFRRVAAEPQTPDWRAGRHPTNSFFKLRREEAQRLTSRPIDDIKALSASNPSIETVPDCFVRHIKGRAAPRDGYIGGATPSLPTVTRFASKLLLPAGLAAGMNTFSFGLRSFRSPGTSA